MVTHFRLTAPCKPEPRTLGSSCRVLCGTALCAVTSPRFEPAMILRIPRCSRALALCLLAVLQQCPRSLAYGVYDDFTGNLNDTYADYDGVPNIVNHLS